MGGGGIREGRRWGWEMGDGGVREGEAGGGGRRRSGGDREQEAAGWGREQQASVGRNRLEKTERFAIIYQWQFEGNFNEVRWQTYILFRKSQKKHLSPGLWLLGLNWLKLIISRTKKHPLCLGLGFFAFKPDKKPKQRGPR